MQLLRITIKNILIELFSIPKTVLKPLFVNSYDDSRFLEFKIRLFSIPEQIRIACSYVYNIYRFEKKMKQIKLSPSTYMFNNLLEFNVELFPLFLYLFDNLHRIKGLELKVKQFFLLNSNNDEFESQLNELICVHFIEEKLKYRVLEIETLSRRILAPLRKQTESCDILAYNGESNIYFECKKSLGQDKKPRHIYDGFESYTPITHYEIKKWIRNQLFAANKKGADYLLIRVPFWSRMDVKNDIEKSRIWMTRTFGEYIYIKDNCFRIVLEGLNLKVTRGFYIVFPNNFIKVEVNEFLNGSEIL